MLYAPQATIEIVSVSIQTVMICPGCGDLGYKGKYVVRAGMHTFAYRCHNILGSVPLSQHTLGNKEMQETVRFMYSDHKFDRVTSDQSTVVSSSSKSDTLNTAFNGLYLLMRISTKFVPDLDVDILVKI